MKTTLILNREYKKRQTFWESFATFNFVILLLAAQINRKIESDIEFSGRRGEVYSRNSEASVSNDRKIPGFCFC